ncbi:MAG TPA: hypothetical protein VGS12_12235 [Caulobacteraceae bacterium]|nr:hypothetical protein [Caulobacteraceae bacterium]
MRRFSLAAMAAAGVLTAGAASGAVTVIGGGLAESCSKAALAERSDEQALDLCDQALRDDSLTVRDRAGTLINRGVIRLRRAEWLQARADLDAAIKMAPKIGEGWINLGALEVATKDYKQGLEDIDKGLALGVSEPEKAYYNRALAYEGLDDEKAAYLDYQQALVLKPGWDLPAHELLRFTVTTR